MIGSSIVSSPEDGLAKLARHAGGVLVVLAVVQLVGVGILYLAGGIPDAAALAAPVGLGAIFVALALWARKDPLTAVLVGLGLYVVTVVLAAIIEPSSLFSGLILKAIVVVMFVNGVSTGLTYNKMKQTLGQSGGAGV